MTRAAGHIRDAPFFDKRQEPRQVMPPPPMARRPEQRVPRSTAPADPVATATPRRRIPISQAIGQAGLIHDRGQRYQGAVLGEGWVALLRNDGQVVSRPISRSAQFEPLALEDEVELWRAIGRTASPEVKRQIALLERSAQLADSRFSGFSGAPSDILPGHATREERHQGRQKKLRKLRKGKRQQ